MKILFLVHQFYPEFHSGTEKVVSQLASMMQQMGHRIKVVTYGLGDPLSYPQRIGDVLYKEYVWQGIPVLAYQVQEQPLDLHYGLEGTESLEFARSVLERERPDIVHVGHSMRNGGFLRAMQQMNIPYVFTLTDFFMMCPKVVLTTTNGGLCAGPQNGAACRKHCSELPDTLVRSRLQSAAEHLAKAKAIVAPSQFVASNFEREFPGLQVDVIPHGIPLARVIKNKRTYAAGDALTIGYVGSLVPHKGVEVLLQAFSGIDAENVTLKLYGIGTDAYVARLKQAAGTDKRIRFEGAFTEREAGEIYAALDVVVIPSLCYESYSMVLREALAAVTPVIVSNLGALGESIEPGENGLGFPPGDVHHLQEQLRTCIEQPELLNEMKKRIRIGPLVPALEQEAYVYERLFKRILGN